VSITETPRSVPCTECPTIYRTRRLIRVKSARKSDAMKIVISLENVNPALEKFEYLPPKELAKALRIDISRQVNERRIELTNRLKDRDVIPQVAFDYFIDIEE